MHGSNLGPIALTRGSCCLHKKKAPNIPCHATMMLPGTYWALVESILYSSWYLDAAHMDTDKHRLGKTGKSRWGSGGGGEGEGRREKAGEKNDAARVVFACIAVQGEAISQAQRRIGEQTLLQRKDPKWDWAEESSVDISSRNINCDTRRCGSPARTILKGIRSECECLFIAAQLFCVISGDKSTDDVRHRQNPKEKKEKSCDRITLETWWRWVRAGRLLQPTRPLMGH